MTVHMATTPERSTRGESEYNRRIDELRERMRAEDLAAVALTGPEDIHYLTGLDHQGYFAFTLLVLPESGKPVVLTRAMESPTIRARLPRCGHATYDDGTAPGEVAARVIDQHVPVGSTVGLDVDSMFFPPAIADDIRSRLPNLHWRGTADLLAAQRAVKSAAEIDSMRKAAAISDTAMRAGMSALAPGVTETTVAAEVYRSMIGAGGGVPGFSPLIRPTNLLDQEHVSWEDRVFRFGSGAFFELSASVHRYHAPLSRTVYIGDKPPGADQAAAAAESGIHAAREALHPGVRTGLVYESWQNAVAEISGCRPGRHHCGYLVGVGFPPSWVGGSEVLGIREAGELEIVPGMTFHLMSWVERPVGHVISDTALITSEGSELLTATSREPIVVN